MACTFGESSRASFIQSIVVPLFCLCIGFLTKACFQAVCLPVWKHLDLCRSSGINLLHLVPLIMRKPQNCGGWYSSQKVWCLSQALKLSLISLTLPFTLVVFPNPSSDYGTDFFSSLFQDSFFPSSKSFDFLITELLPASPGDKMFRDLFLFSLEKRKP